MEKRLPMTAENLAKIRQGLKTQTRRVIKPQPRGKYCENLENGFWAFDKYGAGSGKVDSGVQFIKSPYQDGIGLNDGETGLKDLDDLISDFFERLAALEYFPEPKPPKNPPQDRYQRCFRKRLHMVDFIIGSQLTTLMVERRSFNFHRKRINWKQTCEKWNEAHPYDPMTPEVLKATFYRAITDEELQQEYFAMKNREFSDTRTELINVGDECWIPETIYVPPYITPKLLREGADTWPTHYYKSDLDKGAIEELIEWGWKLKTSRYMDKKYAREWVRIKSVRAERLQSISEEDCVAEGVNRYCNYPDNLHHALSGCDCIKDRFYALWDSINGKTYPWSSNPWVWVYDFERIER